MLSFSLVAEALTGLIYHRPSGENSKFLPSLFSLNKATPPLVTPSSNTTKSTKAPSLGPQRKSSSKLSPLQHKTSTKPSPNKAST